MTLSATLLAEAGLSECGRDPACWGVLTWIMLGFPLLCALVITAVLAALNVRHLTPDKTTRARLIALFTVGVAVGLLSCMLCPVGLLAVPIATGWVATGPPRGVTRSAGLLVCWSGLFCGMLLIVGISTLLY